MTYIYHVRLSVRPVRVEELCSNWTYFDETWHLRFFSKVCREDSSFIEIRQEWRVGLLYMKTFSHLWQYLAKFFSQWEMFQTKVVEKIKTHILCSVRFIRKLCRWWYNEEKCGGARGVTNDVTIWRIRVACWMSKATCTHLHAHSHAPGHTHARTHAHLFIYLLFFHGNNAFVNAPQCYVIRTLPVLLIFWFICPVTETVSSGSTIR